MKKLVDSSKSVAANVYPTGMYCMICGEAGKPCLGPYQSQQNYNSLTSTFAVCVDCCREGVKLLKGHEKIPGQVDPSSIAPEEIPY